MICPPYDAARLMAHPIPAAVFGRDFWSPMICAGQAALRELPAGSWTLLRYEDLLRDPAASLTRLAGFVGVAPDPAGRVRRCRRAAVVARGGYRPDRAACQGGQPDRDRRGRTRPGRVRRTARGLRARQASTGGFMSTDRDVVFEVDGTTTYGTLHVPPHRDGQRLPAALLLAGSGPTDRDGNVPRLGVTPQTIGLIATVLGEVGVMSLRFDKYFSGQTGGRLPRLDRDGPQSAGGRRTGANGTADCGVTFRQPGTWNITATLTWRACWRLACRTVRRRPTATRSPAPPSTRSTGPATSTSTRSRPRTAAADPGSALHSIAG